MCRVSTTVVIQKLTASRVSSYFYYTRTALMFSDRRIADFPLDSIGIFLFVSEIDVSCPMSILSLCELFPSNFGPVKQFACSWPDCGRAAPGETAEGTLYKVAWLMY